MVYTNHHWVYHISYHQFLVFLWLIQARRITGSSAWILGIPSSNPYRRFAFFFWLLGPCWGLDETPTFVCRYGGYHQKNKRFHGHAWGGAPQILRNQHGVLILSPSLGSSIIIIIISIISIITIITITIIIVTMIPS